MRILLVKFGKCDQSDVIKICLLRGQKGFLTKPVAIMELRRIEKNIVDIKASLDMTKKELETRKQQLADNKKYLSLLQKETGREADITRISQEQANLEKDVAYYEKQYATKEQKLKDTEDYYRLMEKEFKAERLVVCGFVVPLALTEDLKDLKSVSLGLDHYTVVEHDTDGWGYARTYNVSKVSFEAKVQFNDEPLVTSAARYDSGLSLTGGVSKIYGSESTIRRLWESAMGRNHNNKGKALAALLQYAYHKCNECSEPTSYKSIVYPYNLEKILSLA